jgi:hypothetical protein
MKMMQLCSTRQRYNLKAIHNGGRGGYHSSNAVFNTSKIQSESNSQHPHHFATMIYSCVQHVKDTI